jgi:hypothetical protein
MSAVIFLALCIILCGCSGEELDQLSIVTCIEISCDESDDNTLYMDAEIINSSNTEDLTEGSYIITASGKNISDCIANLADIESSRLYLGHLRLIIFDKSFLDSNYKNKYNELAEYALKSTELRFNTLLAADIYSDGNAIKAETTSSHNRGIDLNSEIRKSGVSTEIADLINSLYRNDASIDLTNISVTQMADRNVASADHSKIYESKI